MYAWQFARALHIAERHGWTRFISMQNHYNLLYREEEREMMGLCAAEGVGVIPWSPLARGRLTRAPDGGSTTKRQTSDAFGQTLYARTEAADRTVIDRVGEVAAERGVPRAQIALAWLLGRAGVTSPIIGASKPHHLDDAVAALAIHLSEADVKRLEEPYVPHPVAGFA